MSEFTDELLEKITTEYDELKLYDKQIVMILKSIESSSNYNNAYSYGKKLAKRLADIMEKNMPNGEAYYGTLLQILEPSIKNLYTDITNACVTIQNNKNAIAGLGIKAQTNAMSKQMASVMASRLSLDPDYEKALVDYSAEVVDKNLKANMKFGEKLGFGVKVTRTYDGIGIRYRKDACQWCLNRAGTKQFRNATEAGYDPIFERHNGCGCMIDYTNLYKGKRS